MRTIELTDAEAPTILPVILPIIARLRKTPAAQKALYAGDLLARAGRILATPEVRIEAVKLGLVGAPKVEVEPVGEPDVVRTC